MPEADKTLGVKITADLGDFNTKVDEAATLLGKVTGEKTVSVKLVGISETHLRKLREYVALMEKVHSMGGGGTASAPAFVAEGVTKSRASRGNPVGTGPGGTKIEVEAKVVADSLRGEIEAALKQPFDIQLQIANLDELKRQIGSLGGITVHGVAGGPAAAGGAPAPAGGMTTAAATMRYARNYSPDFRSAMSGGASEVFRDFYGALNRARMAAGQEALKAGRDVHEMFSEVVETYGMAFQDLVQFGQPGVFPKGHKLAGKPDPTKPAPVTGGSLAPIAQGNTQEAQTLRNAIRAIMPYAGALFPTYRQANPDLVAGRPSAISPAATAPLAAATRELTAAAETLAKSAAGATAPSATRTEQIVESVAKAALKGTEQPVAQKAVETRTGMTIEKLTNEIRTLYGVRGGRGVVPLSIPFRSVAGSANVMNPGMDSPVYPGGRLKAQGIDITDILKAAEQGEFRGYAEREGKFKGEIVKALHEATTENINSGIAGQAVVAPNRRGTIEGLEGTVKGMQPRDVVTRLLLQRGVAQDDIEELLSSPNQQNPAANRGVLALALDAGARLPLPAAMRTSAAKGGLYGQGYERPDLELSPEASMQNQERNLRARLSAAAGMRPIRYGDLEPGVHPMELVMGEGIDLASSRYNQVPALEDLSGANQRRVRRWGKKFGRGMFATGVSGMIDYGLGAGVHPYEVAEGQYGYDTRTSEPNPDWNRAGPIPPASFETRPVTRATAPEVAFARLKSRLGTYFGTGMGHTTPDTPEGWMEQQHVRQWYDSEFEAAFQSARQRGAANRDDLDNERKRKAEAEALADQMDDESGAPFDMRARRGQPGSRNTDASRERNAMAQIEGLDRALTVLTTNMWDKALTGQLGDMSPERFDRIRGRTGRPTVTAVDLYKDELAGLQAEIADALGLKGKQRDKSFTKALESRGLYSLSAAFTDPIGAYASLRGYAREDAERLLSRDTGTKSRPSDFSYPTKTKTDDEIDRLERELDIVGNIRTIGVRKNKGTAADSTYQVGDMPRYFKQGSQWVLEGSGADQRPNKGGISGPIPAPIFRTASGGNIDPTEFQKLTGVPLTADIGKGTVGSGGAQTGLVPAFPETLTDEQYKAWQAAIKQRQEALAAARAKKAAATEFGNSEIFAGKKAADVLAHPSVAMLEEQFPGFTDELKGQLKGREPGTLGKVILKPQKVDPLTGKAKGRDPVTGQEMVDRFSETVVTPGGSSKPSVLHAAEALAASGTYQMSGSEMSPQLQGGGGGGKKGKGGTAAAGGFDDEGVSGPFKGVMDVRIVSPTPVPVTLRGGSSGQPTLNNLGRLSNDLAPDSKFQRLVQNIRSNNPDATDDDLREALERMGYGDRAAVMFGAGGGKGKGKGKGGGSTASYTPPSEPIITVTPGGVAEFGAGTAIGLSASDAKARRAKGAADDAAQARAIEQEDKNARASRAAAERAKIRENTALQGGMKVRTTYGVPLGNAGMNTVPETRPQFLLPAVAQTTAEGMAAETARKATEAAAAKAAKDEEKARAKAERDAGKPPKGEKPPKDDEVYSTPSVSRLRKDLRKAGVAEDEIERLIAARTRPLGAGPAGSMPGAETPEDAYVLAQQAKLRKVAGLTTSRALSTTGIQVFQTLFGGKEQAAAATIAFGREVGDLSRLTNQRRALQTGLAQATARRDIAQGIVDRGGEVPKSLIAELADAKKAVGEHTDALEENELALNSQKEVVDELAKGLPGIGSAAKNIGAGFVGGIAGSLLTMGVSAITQGLMTAFKTVGLPQIEKAFGDGSRANRLNTDLSQNVISGAFSPDALLSRFASMGIGVRGQAFLDTTMGTASGIAGNEMLRQRMELQQTEIFNRNQARRHGLPQGFDASLIRDQGGAFEYFNPFSGGFQSVGGQTNTAQLLADQLGRTMRYAARRQASGDLFADPGWALTNALNDSGAGLRKTEEIINGLNTSLKDAGSAFSVRAANANGSETPLIEQSAAAFQEAGAGTLATAIKEQGVIIQGVTDKLSALEFLRDFQRSGTTVSGYLAAQQPRVLPNQMFQIDWQYRAAQRQTAYGGAMGYYAQARTPFGQGIAGPLDKTFQARGDELSATLANQAGADLAIVSQMAGPEGAAAVAQMKALGDEMTALQSEAAQIQVNAQMREYTHNIYLAKRAVSDLAGLVGAQGASEIGQLEKLNLLDSRRLQNLQFMQSQRQLNYTRALAGFQYEGDTPEEAADRARIAREQTRFQQQQLNIQRRMFGRGVRIVDQQNLRQFNDAVWQLGELQKRFQEQNRIAQIAQLEEKLGRVQNRVQADINNLLSKNEALERASLDLAQATADATGKTIQAVYDEAKKALQEAADNYVSTIKTANEELGLETVPNSSGSPDDRNGTGDSNLSAFGRGGGFTLVINNPVVRRDDDIQQIVREVERAMNRKAALMGVQRLRAD